MYSLRLFSFTKNCSVRALSYASENVQHKKALTALRKEWTVEHKDRLAREEQFRKEKKQKLILQKAVKLREKKSKTAASMEKQKKIREESLAKYKLKLAETHAWMAEKEAKQQERYVLAAQDLEEESKHWITLDNMDSKITPELFTVPSTTGLTSKHSDLWRYHCFNLTIDRLNHMEATPKTAMDYRRQLRADEALDKRLEAEQYLNSIIGKGDDRAKYAKYLKEYLESQAEMTRTEEDEEEFEEALSAANAPEEPLEEFEEDEDDEELEQMPEIEKKKQDDPRNRRFGKTAKK